MTSRVAPAEATRLDTGEAIFVEDGKRYAIIVSPCDRCGGTGRYAHYGVCYRCGGASSSMRWEQTRARVFTAEERAKLDERAAKAADRKAAKARAAYERAYAEAEERAPRTVGKLVVVHAVSVAEIEAGENDGESIRDGYHSRRMTYDPFLRDVAARFLARGEISEAQATAVEIAWAKHVERLSARRAADAVRKPAPTGRATVEGVVIKVSEVSNDYGTRDVMTVRSLDGWLAWGSVPRGLSDSVRDAIDPHTGDYAGAYALVGCVVRFEAAIEPKSDDQYFSFFKRPTKAEIVTRTTTANAVEEVAV